MIPPPTSLSRSTISKIASTELCRPRSSCARSASRSASARLAAAHRRVFSTRDAGSTASCPGSRPVGSGGSAPGVTYRSRSRSSLFFWSNSAWVIRPRSFMSARRLSALSSSSADMPSEAAALRLNRRDRLLHGAAPADLELVLLLGVEERLLEAVRVGQEADLARSRLGRGQQVDLAVPDDPAEPRMADVHVGDRLQRRVVRVLVDDAARLDHAPRRDEVALDPPHEEVPDEADQADGQRDPERVVEERADRPGDTVVRDSRVEGPGDEPDDEREDEPPPRLEEREPVALPDEQDALTRGEQRVVLRGLRVRCAHAGRYRILRPDTAHRFGAGSVRGASEQGGHRGGCRNPQSTDDDSRRLALVAELGHVRRVLPRPGL